METKTIGLVLSGGGYRGAAHAGAIKAFEEFGIVPHCISGTSSGALAGALYAAGFSPEEILLVFKKVKIFGITRYARNKPGWVDTDTFRNFLLDYFPENSFHSLSKELFVTATDLLHGRTKVFSNGALVDAILASTSFPGVFSPVNIDNILYSDGGILDNFPVDPVKGCKSIYGVYVSPITNMDAAQFKHSYDVINRAFQLRMHKSSMAKFSRCQLVINPYELGKYNLFNAKHIDEIFEIGYRSTCEALKKKEAEIHYLEKVKTH